MNAHFLKPVAWLSFLFLMSVMLCACGRFGEEKQRMKEMEKLGEENAVRYVKEKYGFTPEIKEVRACTECDDRDPFPQSNGYVLASLSDGEREFQVHISGEKETREGQDDYQYSLIMEDAWEYFGNLLGYEIYDIYLEYKEVEAPEVPFPACHEACFLRERYEPGSFEKFMKQHPVNMRIDDCENQDFTSLAFPFLEEYARNYGMRAILISYKSTEDYEKGYSHTYGSGGLLDFDIEKDGLYICSYATFTEKETDINRFELQECDGLIFCCIDQMEGVDLMISAGQEKWLELGETRGEPLSKVYSVDKEESGDIVVYIPTEQYGKQVSVFIQHFYDGKWWQYEDNHRLTKDKRYLVAVSRGFPDSSFDFAVFKKH